MGYRTAACFLSRTVIDHGDDVAYIPLAFNDAISECVCDKLKRQNINGIDGLFTFYYFSMLPVYGKYDHDDWGLYDIEYRKHWEIYESMTGLDARAYINQIGGIYTPDSAPIVKPYPVSGLYIHRSLYDGLPGTFNMEDMDKAIGIVRDRLSPRGSSAKQKPLDLRMALSFFRIFPSFLEYTPLDKLAHALPSEPTIIEEIVKLKRMMYHCGRVNQGVIMPPVTGSQDGDDEYHLGFMRRCTTFLENKHN